MSYFNNIYKKKNNKNLRIVMCAKNPGWWSLSEYCTWDKFFWPVFGEDL